MTTAYEAGESLSLAMGVLAGGCPHQRAEPVILCTGEQVACICTRCYRQLPETWILDQRVRAEREAYCQHDREVEIVTLSQRFPEYTCVDCGRWRV